MTCTTVHSLPVDDYYNDTSAAIVETVTGTGKSKTHNLPFHISNIANNFKKFMQVGINVQCMHASLVGVASLISEIWLPFKKSQITLSGHGL